MKKPPKLAMMHTKALTAAVAALTTLGATQPAQALEQILRPYQSIRSASMGGVRMTTGLYDENLFNNPARATANPENKFQAFSLMAELSNLSKASQVMGAVTGGGDIVSSVGESAGSNTHIRIQTTFPSFYVAPKEDKKYAFGFGLFMSTQMDVDMRQSFQMGAQAVTDIGPAVNFAYKFLHDKLSVGTTAHVIYRLGADPNFTFLNLLQGKSLSPVKNGGQGAMIDFDLGATYELPVLRDTPYKIDVAASITNLIDGTYSNLGGKFISGLTCTRTDGTTGECPAPPSSRAFGFGGAIRRESWGHFTNSTAALEFTDIGADSGSLFRMIHIGAETHWKTLAIRAGINQGYLAAGLGADLKYFTFDLSTYGEEMSLNTGGIEDRRFALQIGLQI